MSAFPNSRPDWWDHAACVTGDGVLAALFFSDAEGVPRPVESSGPVERKRYGEALLRIKADVARAKTVCEGCPVRATCLAGAVARGDKFGVWGGFNMASPAERKTARAWLVEVVEAVEAA